MSHMERQETIAKMENDEIEGPPMNNQYIEEKKMKPTMLTQIL